MTFGEKLADLRKKKGITQEELAEKLQITRQTISKWELDQSTPDLEYISRLSEFFGVTTDYLIKENAEYGENNENNVNSTVNWSYDAPNQSDTVPNQAKAMTPVKVAGLALVILGIVLMFFSIMNSSGMFWLAAIITIVGVEFYAVRKHPVMAGLWTLIAILAVPVVICLLKRASVFKIGGVDFNAAGIILIVWVICVVAMSVATVVIVRKNKKHRTGA